MRYLRLFAAFAAMILAVEACVYPFEPVIEGTDGRLVVEGDIHVGSVSDFSFSRVYPISGDDFQISPPVVQGYIEGEDGTRVESTPLPYSGYGYGYGEYGSYSIRFDTSKLKAKQRYRLHFEEKESGAVYESDWIEVCPPPVIDELSYILDEEREELNVALSMHCNGRSHFRWHYDEVWEYKADAKATCYYDPATNMVVDFPEDVNIFHCWSRYDSPTIKIFSTADQVDDRFVDLEFHRIPRNDKRLQILYQIKVYLEALNEDAYAYWQNIRENSENQGTIFSPTPSQMPGNIHCVSDPSVLVIGFINAAEQAEAEMYYDDYVERFYRGSSNFEYFEIKPDEFALYYERGYIPFNHFLDFDRGHIYQWGSKRCLDCRTGGGTKDKPSYWPNDHT